MTLGCLSRSYFMFSKMDADYKIQGKPFFTVPRILSVCVYVM